MAERRPARPFLAFGPCRQPTLLPKDVVNLFMEVFGTEHMRGIIPCPSPAFWDGLETEEWLEQTYRALKILHYVHLEGLCSWPWQVLPRWAAWVSVSRSDCWFGITECTGLVVCLSRHQAVAVRRESRIDEGR